LDPSHENAFKMLKMVIFGAVLFKRRRKKRKGQRTS
jgi:hypothetical protein